MIIKNSTNFNLDDYKFKKKLKTFTTHIELDEDELYEFDLDNNKQNPINFKSKIVNK